MIEQDEGEWFTLEDLRRRDEQVRVNAVAAERESVLKDLAEALGLDEPKSWSVMLERVRARTQTKSVLSIPVEASDEPMVRAIQSGSLRDMYAAWRAAEFDWSRPEHQHADEPAADVAPTRVDADIIADGMQALVVAAVSEWAAIHADDTLSAAFEGAIDRLHGAAIVLGWVEP